MSTHKINNQKILFQGNKSVDHDGSWVHAIAEGKRGNIWFGTHHGAINMMEKPLEVMARRMD